MIKILYAGSPLASAIVLKKLIEFSKTSGEYQITGVLTNVPTMRGRHSDLIPTEVASVAKENKINLFEFEHVTSDARTKVSEQDFDILVSFDYGRIFGPKFLALFPLGGINLHPSALPLYRGCTPVPAAILNGDDFLGICVQTLALKTDEGDILAMEKIPLTKTETTQSLMDGDGTESLVTLCGAKLLDKVLVQISQNVKKGTILKGTPQSGKSSYTPFIKKEDGIINWNEKSDIIERKIRAYNPWPLCSTVAGEKKLIILKAQAKQKPDSSVEKLIPGLVLPYEKSTGIEILCGEGTVLCVKELQWQGKKAMDYKSFMNGARDFIGKVLGDNMDSN